ncbi:MAG: copper resistance protein NlpE N-terminal domain-containing protein, partial [Bacteroidales bacterium]
GVYEGSLPPISTGPLVKTKVQFNQDYTFSLTEVFPNQKDSVITRDGNYTVVDGVINATYADGNVSYFKIGQGNVQVLSTDQKPIGGANAKDYFLTKTESLPNPM